MVLQIGDDCLLSSITLICQDRLDASVQCDVSNLLQMLLMFGLVLSDLLHNLHKSSSLYYSVIKLLQMSIWSVFSSTGSSCFVCSNHADKLYCCASLAVHPLHGAHSWEWEWAMQTVCVRLAIHNQLRTKYWWQLSKPIKLILTRNNKSQLECYYLYLKYVIIIKSQRDKSNIITSKFWWGN